MPPKNKKRNINANKSQPLNDQEDKTENNRQQQQITKHKLELDDDNNVTQKSEFENKSSTSAAEPIISSNNTLEEISSEEEEQDGVVIAASLNLGQNSQVELKTRVVADQEQESSVEEVEAKQSPSFNNMDSESNNKLTSESSTMNHNINDTKKEEEQSGGGGPSSDDNNLSEEMQMPQTVTTLTHLNAKVYLIGTAHFSTQSQEDVRTVVRQTQPDCILLELCPSRQSILHLDEEMLLREAGDISLSKVAATLRNAPPGSSKVQSLLHLLLLSMSASLTKKLGMAPGGEFRAAVQEAEKLPRKTTLLLGDRPFNVTLARAIASLSLMQKIKLGWQFLINSDDITKEEIEKCKERDLLEKMLSEMTGEFPSITEVFVNERDYFLAHTLYMSTTAIANTKLNGDAVVVAVVGMGHVPGICKNFGKTNADEFDRVGNLPPATPPSKVKWMLKTTVKLTFYGLVGYGAYKLFNRVDFFKKFDHHGFKLGFAKIK